MLVATDVASKGLDFPEIQHVINYDMPDEIENYVHRIGRTGRCGKTGIATTFINKNQVRRRLNKCSERPVKQSAHSIGASIESTVGPAPHCAPPPAGGPGPAAPLSPKP